MTQHLCLCPLCGEGSVHESTFTEPYEYKGRTVNISLHCKECDVCGSEFSDSSVSKRNQRVINATKKKIDHLLDSNAVAMLRKKWSITQAEAGRIFGGGPVAFSKYESDDVVQSEAMDKLMKVADAVPEAKDWLFQQAGVNQKDHFAAVDAGVMMLCREMVSSLNSANSFSEPPVYTAFASGLDMVMPIERVAIHRVGMSLRRGVVSKVVRVEPTVRRYGEEENQVYMHRPTYSEQEYELYTV
nr:type II toxin-antitoxin system MqsA family antitoxin [uncultured Pseudomonas sp.]